MLHIISLFSVLMAIWLIFSGMFKPLLIMLGIASCSVVVFIAHRMDVVDHEGHPLHLTWRAPIYWAWLAKEMLKSGIKVSMFVWKKDLGISPRLDWVKTEQNNDVARTIYANSMTLTPGTVCINVSDDRMQVHALEYGDIDALSEGEMDRKITRLVGKRYDKS